MLNSTIGGDCHDPKRTTSLVFAAACLTAIAAISAHAQPASTYGATPGYTTPQSPAAYGSAPGYTTPPGAATYGSLPGAATYGSPPGYTTPQGSAAYGATPGQQPLHTSGQSRRCATISSGAPKRDREPPIRPGARNKSRVPPGAHAQRMRPNFRSRTASKLPCELSSGRAFCGLIKLEPSSSQRVRPIKDPKSEIGSALRADPSP